MSTSYTRPRGEYGPTNTQSVTRTFEQRLRGVLGRINAKIREFVGEKDWFGINEQSDTLAVEDPDPFNTDNNPKKIALFVNWLREQLDANYLSIVGPDRNEWIETAYKEGIRNVHRQLSDLNVSFEREDANDLVSVPIHRSSLRELYTRTYSNLQSVRDDVATDVRDTLLEGFQEGKGPREIARTLTDRIDSIGKYRSTLIARSETINAHSSGTLSRIDELNEDTEQEIVASHGEWDAAMDNRTCAFCQALNGVEMATDEMGRFSVEVGESANLPNQFIGRNFRLKPPAHPNCRCNIRVSIGPTGLDTPLDERLPNGVST